MYTKIPEMTEVIEREDDNGVVKKIEVTYYKKERCLTTTKELLEDRLEEVNNLITE